MARTRGDLTGQIFGRLTVLSPAEDYIQPNGRHRTQWLCECSCNEHNKIIVITDHLKSGNTQSCGCLRREISADSMFNLVKKFNQYNLSGDYGIGWTSNTNKEFYFDLEDYDKIKDYCWCEHVDNTGYHSLEAWDTTLKRLVKMHHIIADKYYDHIDRNPLNNKKANLRKATSTENARNKSKYKNNTSGFIGVGWNKGHMKWYSDIKVNKKSKHLGYFNNKEDAIIARLEAEAKYYGEFAPQQHLFEQYNITIDMECDTNE